MLGNDFDESSAVDLQNWLFIIPCTCQRGSQNKLLDSKGQRTFFVLRLHYSGPRCCDKTRLLASTEPCSTGTTGWGRRPPYAASRSPGAIGLLSMHGKGWQLPHWYSLHLKIDVLTSQISHMPLTQPKLLASTGSVPIQVWDLSLNLGCLAVCCSLYVKMEVCRWMEGEVLEMDEITQRKKIQNEKIRLRGQPWGTSTYKRPREEEEPAKDTKKEQPERESNWWPWSRC